MMQQATPISLISKQRQSSQDAYMLCFVFDTRVTSSAMSVLIVQRAERRRKMDITRNHVEEQAGA